MLSKFPDFALYENNISSCSARNNYVSDLHLQGFGEGSMNKYKKSANAINSRENLCIEMCALFSRSTHACRITNDTHYRHRPPFVV